MYIDISNDYRVNVFAAGVVKVAVTGLAVVGLAVGATSVRSLAWRLSGLVTVAAAVAHVV